MLECTTGQVIEKPKGGQLYYRLRLNLVDKTANTKKERYKDKYLDTGLVVGGKTNGVKNHLVAQEMLAKAIREYMPVGGSMRFDKYVEYWLNEKKKDHTVELTTKEAYEYKIGYIVRYFAKTELTLAKIKISDIRDFQNSLYEVERKVKSGDKTVGLADRTIRDIMVLLKQIFHFAKENGHLLGANPAASLKLPPKRKKEDDLPYISEDQIEEFRNLVRENCQNGNESLEQAFIMGLFYGLRREEICGLKWSAIRNGNLHVEHTIARVRTLVARDGTKTDASNRACAILPEIQKLLDQIKKAQEKNRELFGNKYFNSDYIFTWADGRPYSPDYLTRKFKKIINKSETLDKRLHLHDLRVSCVSILINNGINIKDVQKWVGHKDIQTTMNIYAKTTQKRQYETGKALEKVLF